jgi:polyhydroxyalkanoate synthesis regulator phasin
MLELMKKTMLAGIGLAIKSKEEVEDLIKDFIKKDEMEEEERTSFLKELKEKAEEARKDLESTIEAKFKSLLKKADVASREEMTELKNEIAQLKQRIESGAGGGSGASEG